MTKMIANATVINKKYYVINKEKMVLEIIILYRVLCTQKIISCPVIL